MKKSVKKLATILMLTAMVGFMGCTVSVGGDPVPQPTVPEQPDNQDSSDKPNEQGGGTTKPDSESGTQGEQGGDQKHDDNTKPPVDQEQSEGNKPSEETPDTEKDPSKNPDQDGSGETGNTDTESGTQGGQGNDPQNPGDDKKPSVDPDKGEGESSGDNPSGEKDPSTNPDKDGSEGTGNTDTESGNSGDQGGAQNPDKENENNPNTDEKEPDTQIKPATPTPDGTREVNGKSYDIVKFGMWPQTVKAEGVKILNEDQPTSYHGWEAYKGNDDAYYVKRDTTLPQNYKGTMQKGINYFKIEPIKWRVLTSDYKGKKLLFSEKALDVMPYDVNSTEGTSDASNKYDQSDIRNFLNNDFFNKAFSEEEKKAILDTIVDNSQSSTIGRGQVEKDNLNVCGDTTDKIFLLSLKEITKEEYGFNVFNKDDKSQSSKENNESRKILASDYTIATGTWLDKVDSNYHCCYWLRSPVAPRADDQTNTVQMIGEDGRNGWSKPDGDFAIVPAFTIE